jgi:hypothetical protein
MASVTIRRGLYERVVHRKPIRSLTRDLYQLIYNIGWKYARAATFLNLHLMNELVPLDAIARQP